MTQRVRRIQVRLRPVFTEYCVARAVLFGSVASGTDTEDSDLSLLVDTYQYSPKRTTPPRRACGQYPCNASRGAAHRV